MKSAKFVVYGSALALAVGAAVASLGAQEPRRAAPREQGAVMAFEAGGARLGVMVADIEHTDKPATTARGVRVEEVTPDSPAEKAGIKKDDVIVEFDGERVRSTRQFTRLVRETPAGQPVAMAVLRGGQRQVLTATPEADGPMTFDMRIDPDRMRGLGNDLRDRMREFQVNPPAFSFRGDGPRVFEWRGEPGSGFGGNLVEVAPRGRLGVSLQELTPQLQEYFGAKDGGALVASVTKDSAAEKAGLKAGDVITSVNGSSMRDADDIARALRQAEGEVTIGVLRDKKATTLKATIDPPEPRRPRTVRPAVIAARPA